MLDENERKLLRAAEIVDLYETIRYLVNQRLHRARAAHRRLGGVSSPRHMEEEAPGMSLCPADAQQLAALNEWFAETDSSKEAFVTVSDMIEAASANGWKNLPDIRTLAMDRMGFRTMSFYLAGNKTRGWVRGPNMLPRQVEKLPRYEIHRNADGTAGFTISASTVPDAGTKLYETVLVPLPY